MYSRLCTSIKFNSIKLKEVVPLFDCCFGVDLQKALKQMENNTYFICEKGGIPNKESTYHVAVTKVKDKLFLFNSEGIIIVEMNDILINLSPSEDDWKKVFIALRDFIDLNHYEYLDLILDSFFKQVFNKTPSEMYCGGIVSAHGDKGYSYKQEWKEAGISFNHGMMLYLLTYTKLLGNYDKSDSCQWVIDHYKKYLPYLVTAEKEVGLID